MREGRAPASVVLALGALLAALSVVAWRQGRALEALEDLEAIRMERALMDARRIELEKEIRALEARGRIQRIASGRLGLRMPEATEIVYLSGEGR